MSLITLFDHIFNLDASSSKGVQNVIEAYWLVWFIVQAIFWGFIGLIDIIQGALHVVQETVNPFIGMTIPSSWGFVNYMPFLQGFTLFEYFPPLLRLIILIYIYGSLISIPLTILAFVLDEMASQRSRR